MKNTNKWFKHFNNARSGATLGSLYSSRDYESIAMWWALIEMFSAFESRDERGKFRISLSMLSRETGMKRSKCLRVLARIVLVSRLRYEHETNEILSFVLPNWLEFQETRGGKRIAKKNQKPDRSKIEDLRSKNTKELKTLSASRQIDFFNFNKIESDTKQDNSNISKVIACYVDAYKTRYKSRPDLRGKVIGQLKILLKDYSLDAACDIIQVYLQMDGTKDWFITKHHDIGTLLENLNSILSALQTGKEINKKKTTTKELVDYLKGEKPNDRTGICNSNKTS